MRWSLFLQEYSFDIEHLKGKLNYSDYISRPDIKDEKCMTIKESKHVERRTKIVQVDNLEDQRKLIAAYHYETGHGGSKTLKNALCSKYKWQRMTKQIENYVNNCEICAREKPKTKQNHFWASKVKRQNEKWEIDLIGPIETSTEGYKYIINCIDVFTRYISARALKSKNCREIVYALKDIFKERKIKPKTITSDNGLELKNKEIMNLSAELGVIWRYASPHHPMTNGSVERFNGILIGKVRKLCEFGTYEWFNVLNKAVEATNASFSRAIQMTPYYATFGCHPNFNIDVHYKSAERPSERNKIKIHQEIRKHLRKYRSEYDTPKVYEQKFKVGIKFGIVQKMKGRVNWIVYGTVKE